MRGLRISAGLALGLMVSGCVEVRGNLPQDAPAPTNVGQVLVDKDGCTWAAKGHRGALYWMPRTDNSGKQICDRLVEMLAEQRPAALARPAAAQAGSAPGSVLAPAPVRTQTPPPAVERPTGSAPALAAPSLPQDPAIGTAALSLPMPPLPAATQEAAASSLKADDSPPTPAEGAFYVQVASFGQQQNAIRSAGTFRAVGLPVDQGGAAAGSNGLYRLVLGPFADKSAAQAAQNTARAKGFADAYLYPR